jgi:hypothetical protein
MLFGMMMGAHGDRVSIAWLCPYTLITSIIDMSGLNATGAGAADQAWSAS